MTSLIGLFYEPPAVPAASSSPAPADEAAPEALRHSMRRNFETLLRQAAPVYEGLLSAARKAFLPTWCAVQGRMDRAHRESAWAEFQAALVEAKVLLAEASGAIIGKA